MSYRSLDVELGSQETLTGGNGDLPYEDMDEDASFLEKGPAAGKLSDASNEAYKWRRRSHLSNLLSGVIGCALLVCIFRLSTVQQWYNASSSSSADNSGTLSLSPFVQKEGGSHAAAPKFAYVQYAMDEPYLCNSIMMFSRLRKFNTTAELVLTFPREWDPRNPETYRAPSSQVQYYIQQAINFNVTLHPLDVVATWEADSWYRFVNNKLYTFNLTEYDRIIHLDSDAIIYKNLDDLFHLPPAPLALPRAYWIGDQPDDTTVGTLKHSERDWLTSALMVIEPSQKLYNELVEMFPGHANAHEGETADMEFVNRMAQGWATILPHRHYFVASGEFAHQEHHHYLREKVSKDDWNPWQEYRDLVYLHFSDWPRPKPWLDDRPMGSCWNEEDDGCKVWHRIYEDFVRERREVCTLP